MNEIERVARALETVAHINDRELWARTAIAAIAAMRGEPVAYMQEHERGERVLSMKAMSRGAEELGWTETALYAVPTPPNSGKD